MQIYPASWRNRYGIEFRALLDDVNPGWREFFDILKGAVKMRMTNAPSYLKFAAAFVGGRLSWLGSVLAEVW